MGKQQARILIVEDEPMIGLTLQDLLVEAGFQVACVAGRLEKALAHSTTFELRMCARP